VEILILHPGALGDVILSLPAISLLRNRYPFARITVAGNIDHLVPVVSGYADATVSLSTLPLHGLYSPSLLSDTEVRFWKSFDLVVSWTGAGDPAFVRRFKEVHPNVRIASWKPDPGEARHVSRLFADSLSEENDAAARIVAAPVFVSPELQAEGLKWLESHGWSGGHSLAALHPGAGSKAKRWPASRFAELAKQYVIGENRRLLIVEGAAESGISSRILPALPADRVMLFDSMRLSLLAAVLEQCDFFIGNDSGVAHLAAALNIRCVVLFGPTLPQHWAPLGTDVTVLRNPEGCKACVSEPCPHTCLENITVEEVVRALTRIVHEASTAAGSLR
jgi:ADP-heptose:LPS heptosyltransferase